MATESQDVEMQEVPFDALNFVKNIIVQQRTCSNNTLELIQRLYLDSLPLPFPLDLSIFLSSPLLNSLAANFDKHIHALRSHP